jgi:integrase/recombinase XerD
MTPGQLCNNLLHKLLVGVCLSERSHVFQVSGPKASHVWKCLRQIVREAVNDFCAPPLIFLSDHETPPARHFGYHKRRPVPHIYSREEIKRLLGAALLLGPLDSLQPQTFATLIGLLAATGLRISEALALQFSDITPRGLLIRKTKFQKTRLVPLHPTAVAHIERYLKRRRQTRSPGQDVFIDENGRPLRYWDVYRTFQRLLKTAGLAPSGVRRHRLHHLRHTFAVRALEASPTGRQRVGRHMLALATYMGHVNIDATYWYLETTPELLRDIAVAGETFLCGGRR